MARESAHHVKVSVSDRISIDVLVLATSLSLRSRKRLHKNKIQSSESESKKTRNKDGDNENDAGAENDADVNEAIKRVESLLEELTKKLAIKHLSNDSEQRDPSNIWYDSDQDDAETIDALAEKLRVLRLEQSGRGDDLLHLRFF